MATRDEYADSSRTGPPMDRASAMREIDFSPKSLAEEAEMDRAAGRPTVGTGEG